MRTLAIIAFLFLASPVQATTNPPRGDTTVTRQTTVDRDNNDSGNWGWLGLLGLAGLAGLLGRKDSDARRNTTYDTTRKP